MSSIISNALACHRRNCLKHDIDLITSRLLIFNNKRQNGTQSKNWDSETQNVAASLNS